MDTSHTIEDKLCYLKIEIKKYKNMSLKIIKEFQRTGGKVPAYAQKLAKEFH